MSGAPRWDGQCVAFELEHAGEWVHCSISRQALQDLSSRRHFKPSMLLTCFEEARPRIEAIARRKLARRSPGSAGRLSIWADDIGDGDQDRPALAPAV
jgi:hypothetical protein